MTSRPAVSFSGAWLSGGEVILVVEGASSPPQLLNDDGSPIAIGWWLSVPIPNGAAEAPFTVLVDGERYTGRVLRPDWASPPEPPRQRRRLRAA
jgi:hypothetical protein